MPRIEELPMPAQNQLRAKRGEVSDEHPEKRRMTLLQRLAAVGLGRKEESAEPPAEAAARCGAADFDRMQAPPGRRARPNRGAGSGFGICQASGAPQGLDPLGRQAAVHNSPEDDQLDIPAFLRRQAN